MKISTHGNKQKPKTGTWAGLFDFPTFKVTHPNECPSDRVKQRVKKDLDKSLESKLHIQRATNNDRLPILIQEAAHNHLSTRLKGWCESFN